MEMEAGRACSRKRKLGALQAPAPADAEPSSPKPAVEGHAQPLPEADGGAGDRISQLPDDVLGDIISLLPTKDGVRTQILASRWRHLWRSAPLNFDHRGFLFDQYYIDISVSRVLSLHPGPGRCFSAPVYHLQPAAADAWLRSPALDNLQELELCSFTERLPSPRPPPTLQPPPAAAFRFSETLRVATLGDCHLPDDTAQVLRFPKLKQLAFERVRISEPSLHIIIVIERGCPVLECLLSSNSFGFSCVRINSATLKSIGMCDPYERRRFEFRELIIQNAPRLQSLLQLGMTMGLHVSVISAPKLETLGCLGSVIGIPTKLVVIDSIVLQGLHVESLTTPLGTIKILALDMHALSLGAVINLMRCFPCLEKLYIESTGPGDARINDSSV